MKLEAKILLMKQAWKMVKENDFTMSEAMKLAWSLYKMTQRLKDGVVKFSFKKKDGSIREAVGTLQNDVIAPHLKGGERTSNVTDTVIYFDVEAQGFRSFKTTNFIECIN